MSFSELVVLFDVAAPTLKAAIRAIHKNGVIAEHSQHCEVIPYTYWATLYNMDMIAALAFRINSYGAEKIRTDKPKSVATDAATALASGVSSLFGSGKMKSLERKNEDLRDEIAIRDETIEQLQSNIKQMQVEHQKQMQEVKQSYEAIRGSDARKMSLWKIGIADKQKKPKSRAETIINLSKVSPIQLLSLSLQRN